MPMSSFLFSFTFSTIQLGAGVPGLLEPGFEWSPTEWWLWFVKAIGLTVASIGSHWKYRSEKKRNLNLVTKIGLEWR
jgi:hypothetical protein